MKKWIAAMLLLALVLFGSVLGFNQFKQQKIAEFMANRPVPQSPVEVVEVQTRDWQSQIAAIGLIEPSQGIKLSTSVSGLVSKIHFSSGEQVKPGQLLVELDRAVEQANLAAAQNRLPAAQSSFDRNQQLYQRNSVSKVALDDAEAEYLTLQSQINSLQAVIDRREIRAPFEGVVGLREVHLGEYLQPGEEITRLESLDAMLIRFSVPQKNLEQLKIGMRVLIDTDAYAERRFEGSITAIDAAISRDSGVVHVQAQIANNDRLLRAGMFASVAILQPKITGALVIPTRAINFSLYGELLYVLVEKGEGDNTQLSVEQRSITVAERQGEWSRVSRGLNADERVVTSGQVRLRNGAPVKLVDDGVIAPGLATAVPAQPVLQATAQPTTKPTTQPTTTQTAE
jgi:membrane fusion protein (multidrug efflux system)